MEDIMDLLKSELSDHLLEKLSDQIGEDRKKTAKAAEGAVSTLISALSRNASTPRGAGSLFSALEKDHDGSIFDDVEGYLGGSMTPENKAMTNGAGILKHVLGGRQKGVIDLISQMSGTNNSSSGKLLELLAPMVMGTLGKAKKNRGLDTGGLVRLLNSSANENKEKSKSGNLIGNLLDPDNLMDILREQMTDHLLNSLSRQIGADRKKTEVATEGIFSALTSALARNASRPKGAQDLLSALDSDHDGSILDDLGGFLSGSKKPSTSSMLNGAGIIKHILGGKQSGVIEMIANMSGLDKSSSGKLMMILAPMVMGALGRLRKNRNLDLGGLAGLLSNSARTQEASQEHGGLLGRLLDQDDDGSIVDDLAKIGLGLFKRR